MKDPIGMRPIWHRVERRVRAHIFVAALAFLMDRMLERVLKDGGVALTRTAEQISQGITRRYPNRLLGIRNCTIVVLASEIRTTPRGKRCAFFGARRIACVKSEIATPAVSRIALPRP